MFMIGVKLIILNSHKTGYYVDKLKRTCEPCDLHCKSCVEGYPSACTSCKTNFYLKDQSCVSKSECRSLYYVDEDTGRCNFCPSQCTRCDSEKHCTECFLSYYLTPDNRCVGDCPKGTFRVASQRFVAVLCCLILVFDMSHSLHQKWL